MTTEQKPTYEELKVLAAKALTDGPDAEFLRIAKSMQSFKADIAKAEAEAEKKEAEAMTGDRAKLALSIGNRIGKQFVNVDEQLAKVKATGFVYHPAGFTEPDGSVTQNATVALVVPVIKVRKVGTGGGGTGKTAEQTYGMKLDAIYEKFATAEDRKAMEVAKASTESANSKTWAVKNKVMKAAFAAGNLKPR